MKRVASKTELEGKNQLWLYLNSFNKGKEAYYPARDADFLKQDRLTELSSAYVQREGAWSALTFRLKGNLTICYVGLH